MNALEMRLVFIRELWRFLLGIEVHHLVLRRRIRDCNSTTAKRLDSYILLKSHSRCDTTSRTVPCQASPVVAHYAQRS